MYTLDNFISFINSLIFIYAILLESRRLRRYWSKIQRLNSPGYRDQKCCDELCRRTIFARPEMITNGIALLWGKRWRYNIAICRLARRWNIAERAIPSTFLGLRGAARSIDYRRPNFFAIQRIRYCNSISRSICFGRTDLKVNVPLRQSGLILNEKPCL